MPEIKFMVDAMLGTLARWLRVLGFDTVFDTNLDDDEILELAIAEERVIISRDRELCARKSDSLFLETIDLDEQISKVLELHPADEKNLLTRCLDCNLLLYNVPVSDVEPANVPTEVIDRYEEFWHCEKCNKYYWQGSHYDNMRQKASQYLAPKT